MLCPGVSFAPVLTYNLKLSFRCPNSYVINTARSMESSARQTRSAQSMTGCVSAAHGFIEECINSILTNFIADSGSHFTADAQTERGSPSQDLGGTLPDRDCEELQRPLRTRRSGPGEQHRSRDIYWSE